MKQMLKVDKNKKALKEFEDLSAKLSNVDSEKGQPSVA